MLTTETAGALIADRLQQRKGKKMHIKILRETFVNGGQYVVAGEKVEVSEAEGKALLTMGKAEAVPEKKKAAPKKEASKPVEKKTEAAAAKEAEEPAKKK